MCLCLSGETRMEKKERCAEMFYFIEQPIACSGKTSQLCSLLKKVEERDREKSQNKKQA